ncbi:dihydrofolate reductase family protein [Roseisolibacter sp. H3M3-2]|uniref:dihydrofolate reductase family protein n=1 Tax=Roseisolibacter sp. H3M3-2 TaxID=3031323 RepID=UPI0023DA5AB7|nr:dihydrofolate reductase family protein [Roseisolibacter sp. H3M3-2]MDF1503500.1 dihydrofolate reductase family protein [Roseisolibacter sp. H3M3-2]
MRTVTYGAACSLDGFIAGPDGAIDWLQFTPDVQRLMGDYWKTVDAVVMGRKTWEVAAAGQPADAPATPGVTTYVCSRTLPDLDRPGVELVRGDAAAFVRDLRLRPGRGICLMGGGELATSLLAAGVVDEVGMNVHPVVLGRGIPFLRDPGRRVDLELASCERIAGGCLYVIYRVTAGVATAGVTTAGVDTAGVVTP